MYKIVFTKGNKEVFLGEAENLELAKRIKKSYLNNPNYIDGIITIEERDEKTNTIKRLIG